MSYDEKCRRRVVEAGAVGGWHSGSTATATAWWLIPWRGVGWRRAVDGWRDGGLHGGPMAQ